MAGGGNVIQFPGGGQPDDDPNVGGPAVAIPGLPVSGITKEQFTQALQDPSTRTHVQWAVSNILRRETTPEFDVRFGIDPRPSEWGVVQPRYENPGTPTSQFQGIVTSPDFPRALANHTHLAPSLAVNIAATYANALGYITQAIEGMPPYQTIPRVSKPDFGVWDPNVAHPLSAGASVVPQRAAGMLALQASRHIAPLVFDVQPPYPDHIAALANPLPPGDIRLFRDIL